MDAHGLSRMRAVGRLRRNTDGATAIEFALTFPLLVTMILGGMWVGFLIWSISSLDYATQTAARCAAVDAKLCGSASATASYAEGLYAGPDISPVFTADASGCGHTVAAQATFALNILPGVGSLPLSASACYP